MRASSQDQQRNEHEEETARRQEPRPTGTVSGVFQQRRFFGDAIIHGQAYMFSYTYYDTATPDNCI
jgi:hypothetical protein